ncbi:CBS domain-containing protein [Zhongshania aliphaticivorans]
MNQNKISCIPIVDSEEAPVGIISWRDIMRELGKALHTKH